jgi:hypothetical protein
MEEKERKSLTKEEIEKKNEANEDNAADKFVDELCKKNPVVGCFVGMAIGIGMMYLGYWLIARGFSRFFNSI